MNQYRANQTGGAFGGKTLRALIALAALLIFVAIFWGRVTVTISPGFNGIVFRQFAGGLDKDHVYQEGFHFIAPWNDMIIYEVRQQEASEALEVLSSNMLTIKMDVTVLYHPENDKIGYLHEKNGVAYETKIIRPAMRSVVRDVVGRYTPEEINTTKRKAIKEDIRDEISEILARNYVVLMDVLVRNIGLPQELQDAINRKLKQEQESLEYEFRLEKEQKEAERKKIEAEGTRRFQEIVNQGLTPNYLQWKGIEATMKLAESPNSKVVIIGSGKDGLPIILGNQ